MTKVNLRGTPEERFLRKVKKRKNDECWLWLGHTTRGYGRIKVNGKMVGTHQFSYELHKGKIPNGLLVCHSCDNPSCVNPKHLWLGTQKENMEDCKRKGRIYERSGEKNPNARLTQKQVDKIREMYATGKYFQKEIGKMFSVKQDVISKITTKTKWKK